MQSKSSSQASGEQAHFHGLTQRIKKAAAFFRPENLEKLILKYDGEIALLVIDVQEEFCDPKAPQERGNAETVAVAEQISAIVPEFRKANIPVYAVYYSGEGAMPASEIAFYKFAPARGDKLVAKSKDSAFAGSQINNLLQRDGKKLLLACGFNQAACVKDTLLDARKAGFQVCLLEDLTANDTYARSQCDAAAATRAMKKAGVVMASSQKVLQHLRSAGTQP